MQASSVNVSLSSAELAAWRGMLRLHAALVRDLDAELRAGHDLSLHEYEVLLTLAEAPEGRMRMSDLAAAIVLSQSGLTRLVDRLVRDGSLARTRCEVDRRGLNADLTDAGRRRYLEARVTHLAGVRSRFLDRFDEAEIVLLGGFWERVVPGATAE
ncbi:MAG: MarR family transcriptional regulator [Thermoleophilia bacterium]